MDSQKGKWSGRKLWSRSAICLFLLLTLWFLSWIAAQLLIVHIPQEHSDVIVILSGSSTIHERVEHAAELFKSQSAKRIVLTNDNEQGGWSTTEQRNPFFYEHARTELIRLGVPPDCIEVLYTPISSTWDEAQVVRAYVVSKDLHSVLIVTSSYHSRRALATFRALFPQNVSLGMDPVATGIQTPSPAMWCFQLRGWQIVVAEYVKLIYYLPRFARSI